MTLAERSVPSFVLLNEAIRSDRGAPARPPAGAAVPSADLANSHGTLATGSILLNNQRMNTSPTLYERLGGESGIESLVIAFYVKVMADPELAPFFRKTSIEKLHAMQKEFFSMALGAPVQYSGRPLAHVHHGRGITKHHFSRFVNHLLTTLEDLGASEAETSEVIDRINSYANEITGSSY